MSKYPMTDRNLDLSITYIQRRVYSAAVESNDYLESVLDIAILEFLQNEKEKRAANKQLANTAMNDTRDRYTY